jgi:hypothetical protein
MFVVVGTPQNLDAGGSLRAKKTREIRFDTRGTSSLAEINDGMREEGEMREIFQKVGRQRSGIVDAWCCDDDPIIEISP